MSGGRGSGQHGSAAAGSVDTTREQRRSRRKREVRACTISIKRMTQREVDSMRRIAQERELLRPKHRYQCIDGPRPCPFISCKYHLFLDVSPRTGSIKLNFPDLEVWEIPASCALDIADRGGTTLEDVGAIMNLTRERIRQLEVKALGRLYAIGDVAELRELCGIQATDRSRSAHPFDADRDERLLEEEEMDEFLDAEPDSTVGYAGAREYETEAEHPAQGGDDDADDFFDPDSGAKFAYARAEGGTSDDEAELLA